MKNIKLLSVVFTGLIMLTACSETTRVEREVEIGPGGSVSQETTIDRQVNPGLDNEIEVETRNEGVTVETQVD